MRLSKDRCLSVFITMNAGEFSFFQLLLNFSRHWHSLSSPAPLPSVAVGPSLAPCPPTGSRTVLGGPEERGEGGGGGSQREKRELGVKRSPTRCVEGGDRIRFGFPLFLELPSDVKFTQ